MTIDEMRALLGLGSEISDAAVVDAWVQALYGMPDADEPVSLTEARTQLGMLPDDPTDQDANIQGMISAAREMVEAETGLILTRRQVVESASGLYNLTLNAWPVVSVDAINYVDPAGEEQSLSADAYRVQIGHRFARILHPTGGSFPATGCGRDVITIVATAGYEAPADVPEAAKRAILILVSIWFRNREDFTMSPGVSALCQPMRRYR